MRAIPHHASDCRYIGWPARRRQDESQMNIIKIMLMAALFFSPNSEQNASPNRDDSIEIRSPNSRFIIRFSEPRSDVSGELWGMITVRDVRDGRERIARRAAGRRGEGNFEGFSPLDLPDTWSPDGLFLAYRDSFCADEPGVNGGVVCHLHEIHFLSMNLLPPDTQELALGRYAFGGWLWPHTVLEIPADGEGRQVKRNPARKR